MMNGNKMTNIAGAIVCGVWLSLAGLITPLHAETAVVAEEGNVTGQVDQSVDDLLNDELLGEIENENNELLNEELLNDLEDGQIEILIYECIPDEQSAGMFFI